MAASRNNKRIIQKEIPKGKSIAQGGNPEQYYAENPAWCFSNTDQEMWSFTREHVGDLIWDEIFPRLKALETQTWKDELYNQPTQLMFDNKNIYLAEATEV